MIKSLKSFFQNYYGSNPNIFAFTIICFFSFLSFLPFYSSALTSDDWSSIIDAGIFNLTKPINFSSRRPLEGVTFYVIKKIFGIDINLYYLLNFLILVLSAYLIYLLVSKLFKNYQWLGLPVSILYLIYPVDYTRSWLVMIYIRVCWFFTLLAMFLLLTYLQKGNVLRLILALFFIIIPLFAYEGQLGVIICWVFALLLLKRSIPKKRKYLLSLVLLILPFFIIWRIWGQNSLLHIEDPYVNSLSISLSLVLHRFILGIRIFLLSWINPFSIMLHLDNIIICLFLIIVLFVAFIIGVFLFSSEINQVEKTKLKNVQKDLLGISVIGALFWGFGFFPMILVMEPSLYFTSTRVNMFSIFGASLVIVSLIGIIATTTCKSIKNSKALTWTLLIPLVLIGVIIQNLNEHGIKTVWNEQKMIWNQIFQIAPNLKDDSMLVLIMPTINSNKMFQHAAFTADWEINSGIEVLYNNQSLRGKLYFLDQSCSCNVLLLKDGVIPPWSSEVVPYNQTVFLSYNQEKGKVTLVEDISKIIKINFPNPEEYHPKNLILNEKTINEDIYRYLVR